MSFNKHSKLLKAPFSPTKHKLIKIYKYSPRYQNIITLQNIDNLLPIMIRADFNTYKRNKESKKIFNTKISLDYLVNNPLMFPVLVDKLCDFRINFIESFNCLDEYYNSKESNYMIDYINYIMDLVHTNMINNCTYSFYILDNNSNLTYLYITLINDSQLNYIINNTNNNYLKDECIKILNCEY